MEDRLVWEKDVLEAIVVKGQASKRYKIGQFWEFNYLEIREALRTVPSAQPKQGKWIGGELGYCTCCGHEGCASDIWNGCKTQFCPNCGAKMEEEE